MLKWIAVGLNETEITSKEKRQQKKFCITLKLLSKSHLLNETKENNVIKEETVRTVTKRRRVLNHPEGDNFSMTTISLFIIPLFTLLITKEINNETKY